MKYPLMVLAVVALVAGVPRVQAVDEHDNIHLHGVLVAEACVIPPGEENIPLDFGSVERSALSPGQRTPGRPFAVHLTQCNPAVSDAVTVTFSGTESGPLPGLLALDKDSTAGGVAIGLETPNGSLQKLNMAGQANPLTEGENRIALKAYLQREPGQPLISGDFRATATFSLAYD